jgi:hypothetical protein
MQSRLVSISVSCSRSRSLALALSLSLSLSLSLAACGSSGGDPDGRPGAPDAPGTVDARADAMPDADLRLACLGDPAPAIPDGTIAGHVFAVAGYQPVALAGASVELRRVVDDVVIDSATSDGEGEFALALAADTPAYFVAIMPGMIPTYAYTDAIDPGEDIALFVIDGGERTQWYADAGATLALGTRTVLAVVRDCGRENLDGIRVATTPAATAVYYDEAAMRWSPAMTATSNGFALIPEAPATATVLATLGGTAFPGEPLLAREDVITLVVMSPYD